MTTYSISVKLIFSAYFYFCSINLGINNVNFQKFYLISTDKSIDSFASLACHQPVDVQYKHNEVLSHHTRAIVRPARCAPTLMCIVNCKLALYCFTADFLHEYWENLICDYVGLIIIPQLFGLRLVRNTKFANINITYKLINTH
jgi:hypothetical protein